MVLTGLPRLADGKERTIVAYCRDFLPFAAAVDTEVREHKIKSHGIIGIDSTQIGRDFRGGSPASVGAPGESDHSRNTVNVGVEWNDQCVWLNGPEPEVGFTLAGHPAGEHAPSLARGTGCGVWEQVFVSATQVGEGFCGRGDAEISEFIDQRGKQWADAMGGKRCVCMYP